MSAWQSPTPKLSLLVVDDDPAAREALWVALERDFEVRLAASGEEALRAIHQRGPALMLLDQSMPGMDGLDLLALLRDEPLPVPVVLSAGADVELVRRALSLGAQDVLSKPCDVPKLVASLLAARRAGKQSFGRDRDVDLP
jgi:CheY-like chemotaxis protein